MEILRPIDMLNLLHRVSRKSHRRNSFSSENSADGGTFIGRGRILTTLCREDGLSQKKLSKLLEIRPQSLSETIVKLAEDGFVIRTPSEQDKRELLIFITEKGRERAQEIKIKREAFAAELFSALSEQEMLSLEKILKKLEVSAENERSVENA